MPQGQQLGGVKFLRSDALAATNADKQVYASPPRSECNWFRAGQHRFGQALHSTKMLHTQRLAQTMDEHNIVCHRCSLTHKTEMRSCGRGGGMPFPTLSPSAPHLLWMYFDVWTVRPLTPLHTRIPPTYAHLQGSRIRPTPHSLARAPPLKGCGRRPRFELLDPCPLLSLREVTARAAPRAAATSWHDAFAACQEEPD